ncbi:MAG TPA: hypothetical protein VF815_26650 [Myxococcaceae bacterium]|jgi:hypothetical protein
MKRSGSTAAVEVSGRSVHAVVEAMKLGEERSLKLLADHGIHPLERTRWYPLSSVLSLYQTILKEIGPGTLRAVGRKLPENAHFPADIISVDTALRAVDTAYRLNHRGAGDIGGYHFLSTGPRSVRMHCDNPYPCLLDEGLLEALCERFRPPDAWVRIEHAAPSCRQRGDSSCTYTISW